MSRQSRAVAGLAAIAVVALAVTAALAEENEQRVPVKDLPKKVVALVKLVCPGGTILSAVKEVEREGRRVEIEYEMKVRQQDGSIVEVEVELDQAGNVRKVQVAEDDDDDDDDEEDDD